jgi:hypothetical protein
MAKGELLKEAQKAGLVAESAKADDYTEAQLDRLLHPDKYPAWKGSLSATEPQVAPDGHVSLSQEDIDARDS